MNKLPKNIVIDRNNANGRIDKYLIRLGLNFSIIQKWIRQGKIRLNNKKVKASQIIQENDEITLPPFAEHFVSSEEGSHLKIDLPVYYEDTDIMVINKPSNFASQGGVNVKVSVADFAKSLGYHIVHRLDYSTSGLMVLAKHLVAARLLAKGFSDKKIIKKYISLNYGHPPKNEGYINTYLEENFETVAVSDDLTQGAKSASTYYKVLSSNNKYSALELSPVTGRKHQLRVHCFHEGFPIIGDRKYKFENPITCKYLCLHAFYLDLTAIMPEKPILEIPLPDHMTKMMEKYLGSAIL